MFVFYTTLTPVSISNCILYYLRLNIGIQGCLCSHIQGGSCFLPAKMALKGCKRCDSDADCPDDKEGCGRRGVCATCGENNERESFAECIPKSPATPRNRQNNCRKDSDCKQDGCRCNTDGGRIFYCENREFTNRTALPCKKCVSSEDCLGSFCYTTKGICVSCYTDAFVVGVAACHMSSAANETSGASNSTSEVSGATNSASEASGANNTTAPCIETAWLKKNDLMHQTIRHAGTTRVLCIPALPCATPGHLLRRERALVSYGEVCETRTDCIESTAAVSQLSHTYDWSRYAAGSLELTSLSAHPESTSSSPSRLLATLADVLNKNGLGSVCNFVAVLPYKFAASFERAILSASKTKLT